MRNDHLMVQSRVVSQAIKAEASAGLWVYCTKNEAIEPTLDDRPGTHDTGFKCRIERATVKPPGLKKLACFGDRKSLRVGGRIVVLFTQVVTLGEDFTCTND